MPKKQTGQIILILVLVMTAALAVGLAVVQRSLTDVSTSTKVEQSSRAFSAAEAGIERALRTNSAVTTQQALGNDSSIKQVDINFVPTGNRPYEPSPDGLKKEDFAQVWLADPNTANLAYNSDSLDIYWGNEGTTVGIPAIEVKVIYQATDLSYRNSLYFYDPVDTLNPCRRSCNHFLDPLNPPALGSCPSAVVVTDVSPSSGKRFYCWKRITGLNSLVGGVTKLIMVRARLLYNNSQHGFAVGPTAGGLPPQGRLLISTGTSGDVSRTVRVLNTDKVLPVYFDYAIFSLGDIRKPN